MTSIALPRIRSLMLGSAALALALPALALYKVVGPDGKVTYTDRPPAPAAGRVSPVNSRTGMAEPDAVLPLELRQAAGRFPVTLYTQASGCEPCDEGRALLRKRGIPFSERQVSGAEDDEALQKLSGGRETPLLTIGAQQLKGFSPETWNNYLDLAGYPRESRLPPGYAFAAPRPLVERPAAPASAPAAPRAADEPPPAPPPGSIRF
ncbi:glutaredoxin family protein [Piscinibacter sp.]|uniref:glutaredoxin family protein n=1 Tax=Piscinibacter sp. TaxID=1903157 RepID=UPI0039E72343